MESSLHKDHRLFCGSRSWGELAVVTCFGTISPLSYHFLLYTNWNFQQNLVWYGNYKRTFCMFGLIVFTYYSITLSTMFVGVGGEEGEGGEEEEDEEFCEALSEFEDGEGEQEWGGTSSSPLQQSQVQLSVKIFVLAK